MEVLWILGLIGLGSTFGYMSSCMFHAMIDTDTYDPAKPRRLLYFAFFGLASTAALIGAGYVWGAM